MNRDSNKALDGTGMTSSRVREKMVEMLEKEGVRNTEVLDAMGKVPRHIFVDSAISHRSYENIPLPIGWQQTISQPLTVARITEIVLDAMVTLKARRHRILEVGGGCGYQASVLSGLFNEVYAVERINSLYTRAVANINKLGQKNIHLAHKDGFEGWEEKAPFDAIIVSAATSSVPKNLLKQLAPNACLVVPIGDGVRQKLTLVLANNGKVSTKNFDEVVFVPMLEGLKNVSAND
ncbi:MAG: protein-L-isoaspartate(D-aspartate) O-methyltransferase [Candidatus Portiera sp.]|nr:protein-L-isoaspartate(D-aspartate) O-methyltransferase [Portiera sp.]